MKKSNMPIIKPPSRHKFYHRLYLHYKTCPEEAEIAGSYHHHNQLLWTDVA